MASALGTINYVINRVSPSYPLLPVTYLSRAKVYHYQKKPGDALRDVMKAIELDPKLVEAYTLAADIHTKTNKRDEALNVVTEGLRHNPGDKVLQRLYDNLGGKPPYPEPIAPAKEKAPAKPAQKADQMSPAERRPGEAQQDQPQGNAEQPVTASKPVNDAESKGATTTDGATTTPPPTIGTPSNPWCRFCPEPTKK